MNDAPRPGGRWWWLAPAVLSLLVLWTYRSVLSFFFSADDLIHLEQAVGILPTPALPWRFLTQVVYFRTMVGLVGPVAPAFMLVNLLLHVMNVALASVLAARLGLSPALRLLASALFGLHVIWITVVGHAVIINDLLALTCGLVAVLAATHPARSLVVPAVLAFAVALLCKESIAAVPLALWAWPRDRRGPGFLTARRALLVSSCAFAILFVAARAMGFAPAGAAYAFGGPVEVFHNAMTYILWFASVANPLADRIRSLDSSAWWRALPLLAAFVALGVSTPRTRPIAWFGLAWWLAGLIPVLPLRNSAYSHYMYVATPGMAIVFAAAISALVSHLGSRIPDGSRARLRGGSASAIAGALVVAVGLAIQADAMIARRLQLSLPGISLPLDPSLRSMVVAGRAVLSVGQDIGAETTRIAVLTPQGQGRVFGARSGREVAGQPEGYDLHRVVLDDGRALRVFYPQIQDVRFVDRWSRDLADHDVFLRRSDGFFRGFGRGPEAIGRAAQALASEGERAAAVELLDSLAVSGLR